MAKRQYPGMRTSVQRANKVSENKLAWVKINTITMSFFRQDGEFLEGLPESEDIRAEYRGYTEDDGDQMVLTVETYNSLSSIPLSEMTYNELMTLKMFVSTAIDEALPVASVRDRLSQEALDDYGDDSNARIYRSVPELFVRKGKGGEYNQSIWERSAGSYAMVKFPGRARQLPDDDGAVAQRHEGDGIPEDDLS